MNPPIASLLVQLEQLSRNRPDRVLRLRGELPRSAGGARDPAAAGSSATHASKPATKSASDAESESKSEFDAETAANSAPETGQVSTTEMEMDTDRDMGMDMDRGTGPQMAAMEPFELLIFRGFCCSVTHPTDFDPDRPLLPEGSQIMAAELLAGPLNPAAEQLLTGPEPVEHFLNEENWD